MSFVQCFLVKDLQILSSIPVRKIFKCFKRNAMNAELYKNSSNFPIFVRQIKSAQVIKICVSILLLFEAMLWSFIFNYYTRLLKLWKLIKFVKLVALFLYASRIHNYAFKSHIGILSIFSFCFTFYVTHYDKREKQGDNKMPFFLRRIHH